MVLIKTESLLVLFVIKLILAETNYNHDCDVNRIRTKLYRSCQYKRESTYDEPLLIRRHRIDTVQYPEYSGSDEEAIVGLRNDEPMRHQRRGTLMSNQYHYQEQQPQKYIYYKPHAVHNEPKPIRNEAILNGHNQNEQRTSIIFPRLAYVNPPSTNPVYIEGQQQYETYYSNLNNQQKRMLRNSIANLIVKCCDSSCDSGDFTKHLCPEF